MTRTLNDKTSFLFLHLIILSASYFYISAAIAADARNDNLLPKDTLLATFKWDKQQLDVRFGDLEPPSTVWGIFEKTGTSRKQAVEDYLLNAAMMQIFFVKDALDHRLEEQPVVKKEIDSNSEIRSLLITKFLEPLLQDVPPPTEEEIRSYYNQHKEAYHQLESADVRYIVCVAEDSKSSQHLEQARNRASNILHNPQLKNDFANIAKAQSDSLSERKGEIISLRLREMNPSIAQFIRSMQPGEISKEPLRTSQGYMIIMLIKHYPAGPKTIEQLWDRLYSGLHASAKRERTKVHAAELLTKMNVRVAYDLLKTEEISDNASVFEFANIKYTIGDLKASDRGRRILNRNLSAAERKILLEDLVHEEMFYQAAVQNKLDRDPLLRAQIEKIRNKILAKNRMRQLVQSDATIEISDREMKDFYNANRSRFMSEKETQIHVIRVKAIHKDSFSTSSMEQKSMAEARQDAVKIQGRIRAGEDFDSLMREYNGIWNGNLDFQTAGPRGRVIDMSVSKLSKGQISPIVQDRDCFYVIKLLDIREPAVIPYDQVKDRVKLIVINEKRNKFIENRFRELALEHGYEVNESGFNKLMAMIEQNACRQYEKEENNG